MVVYAFSITTSLLSFYSWKDIVLIQSGMFYE